MGTISEIIEKYRPSLEDYESLYKHFHSHPELSFVEEETATKIASCLEELRSKFNLSEDEFKVNTSIGGHGLVGIFYNGSGPTILLRADFDGLPVEELTGLPYASKKRMKDADGVEHPVMHACGHDFHITALLAAAELLFAARSEWSGVIVFCFQPAEEKGGGARDMVEGGLYTKKLAPIPDVAIGGHVYFSKTGTIGTRPKAFASAADSLKITVYGRGGHASLPQKTIDPVTLAAYIITRLQSIVSREVPPFETASVTVSSIHAGNAENIIPAFAEMKLNIRTWSDSRRQAVLSSIRRMVEAECQAHGSPEPPKFEVLSKFPLTFNDEEVTAKLSEKMSEYFGEEFDPNLEMVGGSEDFSILATSVNKPSVYFMYGGTDEATWKKHEEEGLDIPINHSAYFAPVIQPTLTRGIDGYAVAALTWLKK